MDELEDLGPQIAFSEGLLADYRPTHRSRTWVEKLLESARETPAERELARARVEAELQVVRVVARDAGRWLEVEDLVGGARNRLWDTQLSSSCPDDVIFPVRLLRIGEWIFPTLAGPALTSFTVDRVLGEFESRGGDLSNLRAKPKLQGVFWEGYFDVPSTPVIQNTDGELVRLLTASFRVADPTRLVTALVAREDIDEEEDSGAWVWFREGTPAGHAEGTTLLGRLELIDDRLLLEVNSAGRLDRAREWIESLPGGARFESANERGLQREDGPLDDLLPGPPPEPPSPEMRAALAELMLRHPLAWIDEHVPALGGQTPREACRTKAGRRRVAAMVRSMPPVLFPGGSIEPPRERILRELGLAE
jgi:hypothetical protein